MNRRALCAAALGVALVSPALAQGQGGPGGRPGGPGGFRGGGGLLGLTRMPEVQKELKLDQAQVELLQGIRPGGPGARPGGPGGPGAPGGGQFDRAAFEKAMAERRAAEEKQVGEILDAKQMARLKQLELQQAGLRGIGRPDVATALKLTPDQKQKIQAALQGEGEAMRATFEAARSGGGQPDFQAMRTKMQEVRSATDANPGLVYNDGIHLTPAGASQYATLVVGALAQ